MSSPPAPPKNRNWLWYFIGIALVAVVLLTWLALFIQQQLDPAEQLNLRKLETVRQLWESKGSKDYQLLYTVYRGGDQAKDTFFVEVLGGRVQSAILNGKQRLEPSQMEHHSMDALLNDIELFLQRDAREGSPPTYCRGLFDAEDGHLMLFSRQVIGGPERVKITVEEYRKAK